MVDAEGWLIPQLVGYAQNFERRTIREAVNRRASRQSQKLYFIWGAGIMPQQMRDEAMDVLRLRSAASYPPIPAWLGDNPPQRAVLMPNGDVLTFGELGLNFESEPEEYVNDASTGQRYPVIREVTGLPWYRYTSDGRLLDRMETSPDFRGGLFRKDWLQLYWPTHQQDIEAARKAQNVRLHEMGRYVVLIDGTNEPERWWESEEPFERKIIRVYDYDGSEVDPDTTQTDSVSVAQTLNRATIEQVFNLQVKAGLTDPDSISPWAGTPEGPQVADPAPQPRPRFASRWNPDTQGESVRVKPLDAPGNPYAHEYAVWDRWIYAHIGKLNLREIEHRNRHRQVPSVGQSAMQLGHYFQPHDDPWHSYTVHVDASGFVIPQHYQWRKQVELALDPPRLAWRPSRTDNFTINAGGVPASETIAALEQARWELLAPLYPPVPDWLAEQPVHYTVFMPNGDVLTYGPLGSRRPEHGEHGWRDAANWAEGTRGWFRYSAAGELLGQHFTEGFDWAMLYNPQLEVQKLHAQSLGLKAHEWNGFLIAYESGADGGVGDPRYAFDYDGSPVEPDSLRREPKMGTAVPWAEIEAVGRWQRGLPVVAPASPTP